MWPSALIGVDDPLFVVARRTFAQRPFVHAATWSNDPIQAARLGLGAEVAGSIYQLVQLYQVYPNGMAALIPGPPNEFYIEQAGVVTLALSEILAVQDEDGTVRIGPALPPGWTLSGRASLHDSASVNVEAVDGELAAFTLHGGNGTPLRFATPWQTRRVQISQNRKPFKTITGERFGFTPAKGSDYRFELADNRRIAIIQNLAPLCDGQNARSRRDRFGTTVLCAAAEVRYRLGQTSRKQLPLIDATPMNTEPTRKRWPLIRAVALLQLKLLMNTARDLVLIPALVAALVDLVRLKRHEPQFSYRTERRRARRPLDRHGTNNRCARTRTRENVDALLSASTPEEVVRDPQAGARHARVLKRWAEKQMARAKQRATEEVSTRLKSISDRKSSRDSE